MSAAELLASLERLGFRLWIDGEEISGEGPTESLTEDLLAEIREAKVELLAILQGDRPAATPKPPGPESWRMGNELSTLGPEGFDFAGEDKDLAPLYRRADGQPRRSIY